MYVVLQYSAKEWSLTRERLPHELIHSLNFVDINQPASQPAIYRCDQLYCIVIIVLECGICLHSQLETLSYYTYTIRVRVFTVYIRAHNLFAYANSCANMIRMQTQNREFHFVCISNQLKCLPSPVCTSVYQSLSLNSCECI